jgi:hypothetical protein
MAICIVWRLGYQAIQLFTISRGSRSAPPHTPEHDRRFPGMLLFPESFRIQVSHQTQEHSSKFFPTKSGIQRSASWRTYATTCAGNFPSERLAPTPCAATATSITSRGIDETSTPIDT